PGDRLTLRAARRWDRMWDELNSTGASGAASVVTTRTLDAPQLGARARLGLGIEARANWSRAAHAPDFAELFGDQGSVLGNPALVPETAENRDAGLAWTAPATWPVALSAGWTVFDSRYQDLIIYVRNSQSSVRAQNISSARIGGHEATLQVVTPGGFSASLAFTTQEAVDTGPVPYWHGKRLPQHPEQEGSLRCDWSHRAWGAGASLDWLGDDYLDRYNRYRVEARRLLGATLRAPLVRPALALTLEGKNLTDDRASDVAGFPLPGRSFYVALETRLGSAPSPAPR
ncbi:MAG TPA: TonB-dependent receptor, partial [Dongiaceae bacterium]|nr:TonB-dependent receptor [Dongiaceae bacterium]